MSKRLLKIDELSLGDHSYLTPEDKCFYLVEYTSGTGYNYSSTNSFISNFKKPLSRKGKGDFKHKLDAIEKIASVYKKLFSQGFLKDKTLVPMPPSKAKNDPLYDDRMVQVLGKLCTGRM